MKLSEILIEKVTIGDIPDPASIKTKDDAYEWVEAIDKICVTPGQLNARFNTGGLAVKMSIEDIHSDNFRKMFEVFKGYGFVAKGAEAWKYTVDSEKAKTVFSKDKIKITVTYEFRVVMVSIEY